MFVLRRFIMAVAWEQGVCTFADTQGARRRVFKVELRSTDYTSLVKTPSLSPSSFYSLGQSFIVKEQKGKRRKGMRVWDVGKSSGQFLGCESRGFIGDSPLRLGVHKLKLALLRAEDGYATQSDIFPKRLGPVCVEPSAGF